MLGIRDTIEQNSREEKEKTDMSHFLETVRQKEDGRYEVHMPWKVDRAFLTDNYELCLKRLESTTRKLEKIGFREKYHEVFREWLAEGVIEEIPGKELPVRTHYLPHRPVIKETSTTSSMKIRPVFDASAKINNHPSLNDCLETGNNLIESVPAILARFRLKPIGVISDIRRAFLQISLHEKDRDFVRYLWYDNEGNIRTYRHARVAFGVTSSPFLLMAVINYHLLKESVKERYSEEFFKKLQDSFYVDNCVTSVQNNAELRIFVESASNVMKEGMFDLRGWESSAIPSESTTSLVLGLICDKNSDTLEIDSESLKFDEKEKITKRKILSLVSRVFDPIGFLAPVMIQPKILLQATWKTKEAWDDEVNDEIRKKFLKWGKQLKYFKNIKIPRWLGVMEESNLSIHTLVDASKTAYAACIFLRSESNTGSVTVQLLQARSRITPMKTITIPRLELMAATIGARLFSSVKHALKISNIKTYFWTDSSTVLTWIIRREQWSVFVANRISEIRKLTTSEDWFHISTDQNPADIL
ncbi:integrase catalytic domain-containing protein [Trichonephila clavipes]|nr:integrase catalytic domain-containing protein [Trichonephila clavipes]